MLNLIFLGILSCALGEIHGPVDLTFGFDNESLYYPGGDPFVFTRQYTGSLLDTGFWYSINEFKVGEHTGTHIDAPYHTNPNGRKLGSIPVEKLVTKGVLVDVSEETNGNVNYVMPKSKLIEWEQKNGPIPENSVVLVKFGWSSRWPKFTEYMGPSTTELQFPGLSAEAGEWIVNTKKVVGLGVDTASPDVGTSTTFPIHVLMSQNDMYILENVNLSAPLPPTFNLLVMPMKIMEGTGGPCRIVATPLEVNNKKKKDDDSSEESH